MAIQTKMTFRFNGGKVDAIGARFEVSSDVPGGVAQGSEGPIDQYTGMGETHALTGVTFRIRPNGLPFVPWEHTRAGQEFEVQYDQGDPDLGGRTITLQNCLCRGERTVVNNENGDIYVEIPQIVPTRRVPESDRAQLAAR